MNKGTSKKYPLPYIQSITSYKDSYYALNEFREVFVHISENTNDGSKIQSAQVIATLPEGFRPEYNIAIYGAGSLHSSNPPSINPLYVYTRSNGEVALSTINDVPINAKQVRLYFSFNAKPKS